MWRWYRDAKVCYAYLNDVVGEESQENELEYPRLGFSQWFDRGWTLQELLAPPEVLLFDSTWNCIGPKHDLAQRISRFTGIREDYIKAGASFLSHASIAERMSWASVRKTKREEDIAYCLLGIFDINMPLLYGEGPKAFQRLQEEIMKQSNDQSIFAWGSMYSSWDRREARRWALPLWHDTPTQERINELNDKQAWWDRDDSSDGQPSTRKSHTILAGSPVDFKDCGNVVRSIGHDHDSSKPYAMTNKGLEIQFSMAQYGGQTFARLNCRPRDDYFADFAIPIQRDFFTRQYQRSSGCKRALKFEEWHNASLKQMYISVSPQSFKSDEDVKEHSTVIRTLPSSSSVSQVFPRHSWIHRSMIIEQPEKDKETCRLVLITSFVEGHTFLIILFPRIVRFTNQVSIIDARFVPGNIGESPDLEKLHSIWSKKNLSRLPRTQKFLTRTLAIRATPELVRSRRFTMINIDTVSTKRPYILELREEFTAQTRYVSHYKDYLRTLAARSIVQKPPFTVGYPGGTREPNVKPVKIRRIQVTQSVGWIWNHLIPKDTR